MYRKSLRNTVLEPHKYMSIMASTKTCQCTGCNTAYKDYEDCTDYKRKKSF